MPMAPPRERFVWWRLQPGADAEAALRAAAAVQRALRAQWPGLHARLYRREPEAVGRGATVMETYAWSPGPAADPLGAARFELAFDAALDAAGQALAPWCDGGRHAEVFTRCDTAA